MTWNNHIDTSYSDLKQSTSKRHSSEMHVWRQYLYTVCQIESFSPNRQKILSKESWVHCLSQSFYKDSIVAARFAILAHFVTPAHFVTKVAKCVICDAMQSCTFCLHVVTKNTERFTRRTICYSFARTTIICLSASFGVCVCVCVVLCAVLRCVLSSPRQSVLKWNSVLL